MEIQGPALTGIFLGMVWALVKVVEYFLKKYKKEELSLNTEQSAVLKEIHERCSNCGRFGTLTAAQIKTLENIEKISIHLDDLHSVYDENHIPKWYVPKEILPEIKQLHNEINKVNNILRNEFLQISTGQSVSINKMSELINSQKLVTERLGDLVVLWSKSINNDGGVK